MKKILDSILPIILAVLIGLMSIGIGTAMYNVYSEMNQKLDQLYADSIVLYQNLAYLRFESALADKIILNEVYEKAVESVDRDIEIIKKPSYEYLYSVTVPIFREKDKGSNEGWIGTGTIIKITDDYTYIITNKHVAPVNSDGDIYVVTSTELIKTSVVKNHAFRDLSIIKISEKLKDKQVVNGFSTAYPSEKIYSVGMYLGNAYIYTEGTFAGYQEDFALVNMPSSYGCSGSGVFDKDGNLVAIVFATNLLGYFDSDSSKAVCIDSEDIKLFLEGLL